MDRADLEVWRGGEVARLLALVETERRYYEEILSRAPVAMAVIGRDLGILLANRAFRKATDLRPGETATARLLDLIPLPDLDARIRQVLDSGKSGERIP